jgi:RNA polymerase sigma factor (TIGR02999 family)
MQLENSWGMSLSKTDEGPPELGQRRALDQLFSITYEELRRLASTVGRGDPSATMTPTALVNEAWIKLAKTPGVAGTSKLHFKRIAARAMRQLLVEAARRRNSQKRGGNNAANFVTFEDSLDGAGPGDREILALNAALSELAQLEPRQSMIVELHFFGGAEFSEIARHLDISEATVFREWRSAKAWLGKELRR